MKQVFEDWAGREPRVVLELPPNVSPDAIEHHQQRIDALLEQGWIELPRWLTWTCEDRTLLLRPPLSCAWSFCDGANAAEERRAFSTPIEAIQDYNTFIKARIAEGFALRLPTWHEGFEHPGDAFAEVEVYDERAKNILRSRCFKRRFAPFDGVGPELSYTAEGALRQLNAQLNTAVVGVACEFKLGALTRLVTYHRGAQAGPTALFRLNGALAELKRQVQQREQLQRFGREGAPLFDDSADGEALSHPRGSLKESFRPESYIQITSNEANQRLSFLSYRPNGILQMRKVFDPPGSLALVTFHDDAGALFQRHRQDGDAWCSERLHPGTDKIAARAPLDANQLLCGAWVEFDLQGRRLPLSPLDLLLDALESPPSLELADRIAALVRAAFVDLQALKPEKTRSKTAWSFKRPSGAQLALKLKKEQLASGELRRPDGTCAATFICPPAPRSGEPALSLTLYHADGATPLLTGEYTGQRSWSAPEDTPLELARNGWWLETSPAGAVIGAQCYTPSATNPLHVTHRYDDLSTSLAGAKSSFSSLFGEARHEIHQPPTRPAFLNLCKVVERAALTDPERTRHELIPYLRDLLNSWPERLRAAPLLWINRLITGALPAEALHLTTALSLTAALTEHYLRGPFYPLLLRWLQHLPADAAALVGLSLSYRSEVAEALRAAIEQEPDARFHPTGKLDALDQNHFIDPARSVYKLLFGNPLCRDLRVLDLAWDHPYDDLDWDQQGILDGRGLTFAEVAEALASDHLEALDLAGQCVSPRAPLGSSPRPLPALKRFHLGDGHPLGDAALKQLVKLCPNLEHLNLRPGPLGDILDGYDFDEFDPGEGRDSIYGRLMEHWLIYGNDDLQAMRLTASGRRAIASLKHLRTLKLDACHAQATFPEHVQVYALSRYRVDGYEGPGIWAERFDP